MLPLLRGCLRWRCSLPLFPLDRCSIASKDVSSPLVVANDVSGAAADACLCSASAGSRRGTVEWLRLLCSAGIVFFHCKSAAGQLGYGGLPVLMALSVAFAVGGVARRGALGFVRERAVRLLVCWVFWSAVYAALKISDVGFTGGSLRSEFSPWMYLTGPSIHLWYLPCAFVSTIAAGFLPPQPWRGRVTCRAQVLGAAAACCVVLCSWALSISHLGKPAAQWVFVIPAMVIGAGIPELRQQGEASRATTLIVAAWTGAGIILSIAAGWAYLALPYAVAVIAVTAAVVIDIPSSMVAEKAGSFAYGIYLVHPALDSALMRVHHVSNANGRAAIVLAAAFLSTAVLRATPLRRFI